MRRPDFGTNAITGRIFMFLDPSGGIIYHFRAFLYGKGFWMPFRESLAIWLKKWRPPEKRLLIIGASGGYMLDYAFLDSFCEIKVIDPDPLARLIFFQRFHRLKKRICWDSTDYFSFSGMSNLRFERLLKSQPDAAVLFSNILGQIAFLIREESKLGETVSYWAERMLSMLEGRSWASYHDRYSGFDNDAEKTALHSLRQMNGEELIKSFYRSKPKGEWTDHLTEGFFPGLEGYEYFLWRMKPDVVHIIEGACSRRKQKCK